MISFADALTDLSDHGGGHPAHAAMLLAGAVAARRGSLPPVTEPDAWSLTEEEVTRARAMLDTTGGVPPYRPAPTPQAEPEPLPAHRIKAGDQVYCQGDLLVGHHRPGWCTVDTVGQQRSVGPYGVGATAPGFGLSCGRLWSTTDPQDVVRTARRHDRALAS